MRPLLPWQPISGQQAHIDWRPAEAMLLLGYQVSEMTWEVSQKLFICYFVSLDARNRIV